MIHPNIWENKNCSKPPTSYIMKTLVDSSGGTPRPPERSFTGALVVLGLPCLHGTWKWPFPPRKSIFQSHSHLQLQRCNLKKNNKIEQLHTICHPNVICMSSFWGARLSTMGLTTSGPPGPAEHCAAWWLGSLEGDLWASLNYSENRFNTWKWWIKHHLLMETLSSSWFYFLGYESINSSKKIMRTC